MSRPSESEAADRRLHRRLLCSELVELRFKDQTGRRLAEKVLLEDVSKGGASVSSSLPVARGRQVELVADGFARRARIRFCEIGEDGYLLGLQFDDEWDREAWQPEHLTSLE